MSITILVQAGMAYFPARLGTSSAVHCGAEGKDSVAMETTKSQQMRRDCMTGGVQVLVYVEGQVKEARGAY